MMNLVANKTLVNIANLDHRFLAKRLQVGRKRIVLSLCRPFRARNNASDRIKHQDPAQGELSHGHAIRD